MLLISYFYTLTRLDNYGDTTKTGEQTTLPRRSFSFAYICFFNSLLLQWDWPGVGHNRLIREKSVKKIVSFSICSKHENLELDKCYKFIKFRQNLEFLYLCIIQLNLSYKYLPSILLLRIKFTAYWIIFGTRFAMTILSETITEIHWPKLSHA